MKKVFILFFLLIFSHNTSVLSNDLQNQLDKYQKEYCEDNYESTEAVYHPDGYFICATPELKEEILKKEPTKIKVKKINKKNEIKQNKSENNTSTSYSKANKKNINIPNKIIDGTEIYGYDFKVYTFQSSIDDYYYLVNKNKKCLYGGSNLNFRACKPKDRLLWRIKIVNIYGGGITKWNKDFIPGSIIIEIYNKEKNKCLVPNKKNDPFKVSMECSKPALFNLKGTEIDTLCIDRKDNYSLEEEIFCNCSFEQKLYGSLYDKKNCLDVILSSRGELKNNNSKNEIKKISNKKIFNNKKKIHKYEKFVEPEYYDPWMDMCNKWDKKKKCYPEEEQLFGHSWTTEQEKGGNEGIKRKAAEEVIYRFIKKKKTLGKYPHLTIKGMAYLEILYNQMIWDRSYDKKLLNDLRSAVISFRNSFNFSKNLSVNEAVARYWALAYIIEHGKTKKNKVPKDLLFRKGVLQNLKKSTLMVRSFIDFDSSISNNQNIKINDEKKFTSLTQEVQKIVDSFDSYYDNVKKPKSQLSKNIDISLNEYKKISNFILEEIKQYNETKNNEFLIAATYAMDLLINTLDDTISKIPNEYVLNMGNINPTFKKLHAKTINNLTSDINKNKIQKYKNNLIYVQRLEEFNFNSLEMLESLNNLDLGLENFEASIKNLDLDSLDSVKLDIENINTSIQQLENVDVQEIASTIEQSTKAVEMAVEEVAQSIFEMVTLKDVMDVIHDEIKPEHTWFALPTLEEYIELKGMTGVVDETTTFSDAVKLYNQAEGTSFSDEEALFRMASDVCNEGGFCSHPEFAPYPIYYSD